MSIKRETVQFSGFKELDKALDKLTEDKFRKAALRNSGKMAMAPVLFSAKKNAPVLKTEGGENAKAGQLRDDIKMSTSVNVSPVTKSGKVSKSKKDELKVVVKTGKDTEDYALVTEYGREPVTIKKVHVFDKVAAQPFDYTFGEIQPRPFMQPALYDNKGEVLSIFYKELGSEIMTQAKKQEKYLRKK